MEYYKYPSIRMSIKILERLRVHVLYVEDWSMGYFKYPSKRMSIKY